MIKICSRADKQTDLGVCFFTILLTSLNQVVLRTSLRVLAALYMILIRQENSSLTVD